MASVTAKLIAATILAALSVAPATAQISMQRPGITGLPQARKKTAPTQAPPAVTLNADEEKRLDKVIKHMKRKDRKKLAQALQKMTPQQRQQLLRSVKQQLSQQPAGKSRR
jgi:DNA-directed RNA polymerase specialized sigma24 family protein